MNLFDYINSKEIAAYVTNRPENNEPYFAETLFPSKKQLGTDISWLKGSNGLPVALQPSNYDAKARMREKEGFESVATEMAFFREAMRIGEKDRQQLNMLLNHPQSEIALPIIRKIFDEAGRLVDGARVQAEIMRMQLMTEGKINVVSADGRAQYIYDYGQKNKFNAKVNWASGVGNNEGNPIQDLIDTMDKMELKRGKRPTRAVMNRETWLKLYNCKAIHLMMYPTDSELVRYISEDELKSFVERVTGLSFFIYSKKVGVLDHTTGLASTSEETTLMPKNKVVLFPSGNLGNTYFGTTPEESDLMSGSDAQVSIVNNGTAITTFKEKHPVQVVTVVSSVMIPSFEGIDDVAVLTVGA